MKEGAVAREKTGFEFFEWMKVVSEHGGEGGHAGAYDSDAQLDLPWGVLVNLDIEQASYSHQKDTWIGCPGIIVTPIKENSIIQAQD